jgi:hypothetical protein
VEADAKAGLGRSFVLLKSVELRASAARNWSSVRACREPDNRLADQVRYAAHSVSTMRPAAVSVLAARSAFAVAAGSLCLQARALTEPYSATSIYTACGDWTKAMHCVFGAQSAGAAGYVKHDIDMQNFDSG